MFKGKMLAGVGTFALALVLIGGGCGSAGDTGSSGSYGDAEERVASVTFGNSNVTVDCADADWVCTAEYNGTISLEESVGFGGLTITEMFSDDLDTAADTQLERLEDVIEDMEVVDAYKIDGTDQGAVKITSSNGKVYFISFNKLDDGKVYQCQVSVPEAAADSQKPHFEKMCASMRAGS